MIWRVTVTCDTGLGPAVQLAEADAFESCRKPSGSQEGVQV